jgi:membrane protease YdiL (CAAX protease family)
MVVQILFQIPLTARTPEIALAIVFCSISEEVFFRGFLIGMTIKFSKNVDKNNPILKYLIIAAGIMLSSIFFTLIHINYYDNIALLATIFVCGLVLAIAYLISDDLMAVIIGHFILNAIVSFQLLTQILIGG